MEARQSAELRRYIVARLLPSEELVLHWGQSFYWQLDQRKLKQGVPSGRWYKARVLSQEGAVCVIDTGATVLWANQSKLRKERNAWDDVQPPPDQEQLIPPIHPLPRERLRESSAQSLATLFHKSTGPHPGMSLLMSLRSRMAQALSQRSSTNMVFEEESVCP